MRLDGEQGKDIIDRTAIKEVAVLGITQLGCLIKCMVTCIEGK